MSEHLKPQHSNETIKPIEMPRVNHDKPSTRSIESEDSSSHESINKLRQTAFEEAKSSTSISKEHASTEQSHSSLHSFRALRSVSYASMLSSVRKHLNTRDKAISRLIHKPTVEKLSEVASATVARPTGLFSAGLFAFIGSIVSLYMAKEYGFIYNTNLFILLLVVGYVVGLVFELLQKLLTRNRDI